LSAYAKPATFKNIASRPFTDDIPADPQAALLAQGLINNSVEPAEPALSSLPAHEMLKKKNN
jgi:hypothetical protein